jgi:DNA polymerase I-like protein with 3'-5' exonuclease and polymerase domains
MHAASDGQTRVPGKKNKIVDEWVETSTKTYKNGKVKTVEKPKRRTRWEETWVDEPLNPNSPTQLSKFLFEHLRLRPPGGERTTGKEFRDAYPTHPVTRLLAEHGLMSHMMGTYVKGMHKHIRADGRVHPSIHAGRCPYRTLGNAQSPTSDDPG